MGADGGVVTEIPTDAWSREPWVFESIVTDPDRRIQVHVTVTAHAQTRPKLLAEVGELTQMAAQHGMDHIAKRGKEIDEEPPF
jgi:hypothetical protein